MKRNKKLIILLVTGFMLIIILFVTIHKQEGNDDPRGKEFAGSVKCRQCHQTVYDSYLASNHYRSSQASSKKNIKGSFTPGQNAFSYSPNEKVVMESREGGLFQVDYLNGKEKEAHPFDITFGLKNGQTYLYWKGDTCFQLPVSYYSSSKSWGTSPGFATNHAQFNRVINKNCFECHVSYINSKVSDFNSSVEVLDKESLINGIDCERCHGPSIDHVNYQLEHPNTKQAKYIVTSNSLSRQQKLDMCAVCHAGNSQTKVISTFHFKLGDTLNNFLLHWPSGGPVRNSKIDVHGNQLQLLASSQCFLKSKTLTCTTCHNPHTNASTNLSEYSAKCISCHQNVIHDFDKSDKSVSNENNLINGKCIDCHMPKQPSQVITFMVNGKAVKTAQMFHTHKIAIYNQEQKKIAAISGFLKMQKA